MPDEITAEERSAITAFMAERHIEKSPMGSAVPYGEECLGRSGFWNQKKRRAWALNSQMRDLNSQGFTKEQIGEKLGLSQSAVANRGLKLGIWNA